MGVCQSCLGRSRQDSANAPSETSRLLSEDPFQSPYGAVQTRDVNASTRPQPDPEQLKRERDALERICAQTADKLIDVSQTSHAEASSKININYARLFKEIFPDTPNQAQEVPDQDTETAKTQNEREWLRRIFAQDPSGASWNCNVVHEIDKPILFNFDDLLRNNMLPQATPQAA